MLGLLLNGRAQDSVFRVLRIERKEGKNGFLRLSCGVQRGAQQICSPKGRYLSPYCLLNNAFNSCNNGMKVSW